MPSEANCFFLKPERWELKMPATSISRNRASKWPPNKSLYFLEESLGWHSLQNCKANCAHHYGEKYKRIFVSIAWPSLFLPTSPGVPSSGAEQGKNKLHKELGEEPFLRRKGPNGRKKQPSSWNNRTMELQSNMPPPCSQRRKRELEVSISWDPVPPPHPHPGTHLGSKEDTVDKPNWRLRSPSQVSMEIPWLRTKRPNTSRIGSSSL